MVQLTESEYEWLMRDALMVMRIRENIRAIGIEPQTEYAWEIETRKDGRGVMRVDAVISFRCTRSVLGKSFVTQAIPDDVTRRIAMNMSRNDERSIETNQNSGFDSCTVLAC